VALEAGSSMVMVWLEKRVGIESGWMMLDALDGHILQSISTSHIPAQVLAFLPT